MFGTLIPNKVYDEIYFSDLHYGMDQETRPSNEQRFLKFIGWMAEKDISFRKITSVGDIVDDWVFDIGSDIIGRSVMYDKLFISGINSICEDHLSIKKYIIGNHCSSKYNGNLHWKFQEYLTVNRWNVCHKIEEENRVVIHGHQGEYSRLTWALAVAGVKILYLISSLIPGLFKKAEMLADRIIDFNKNSTEKQMSSFYKSLTQRVKLGNRILICGHTHQPIMDKDNRIINTGDWVINSTAIVRDGKNYLLLNIDEYGQPTIADILYS